MDVCAPPAAPSAAARPLYVPCKKSAVGAGSLVIDNTSPDLFLFSFRGVFWLGLVVVFF